jgi:hypothetical protein
MEEARRLLAGAAYGPETLKVIGQTFDDVWAEIAQHFPHPLEMEAARLRLANILLDLAKRGTGDTEGLKNLALQMMTLTYRRLRGPAQRGEMETPSASA